MRAPRTLTAVPFALAAAAVLVLSGCGAAAPDRSPSPVVPKTPSASPSASASVSPSPSASGGGGKVDPNAPQGQCADDAMKVAVAPAAGGGAAGSIGYAVTITNVGSTQCVLDGYPGVSVVGNGNGTQLGPAADRQGDSPKPVTLAPNGGSVTAPMTVTDIAGGVLPGCQVVSGDGWRVYPPHSFRAYFVAQAGVQACANGPVWLHLTSGVARS